MKGEEIFTTASSAQACPSLLFEYLFQEIGFEF
jgi:hypothetical protein